MTIIIVKPKEIDEVVVGLERNFCRLQKVPWLMLVSFLRRGERKVVSYGSLTIRYMRILFKEYIEYERNTTLDLITNCL